MSGLENEQVDLASAIAHATTAVPVAGPDDTIGDVRRMLMHSSRFESAADIAVLDRGRLVGLARIEDVLRAGADALLGDVMSADPPVLSPDSPQESAAMKAVVHGQGALAVVDDDGRWLGLIPAWRMLGVLSREHDEDLARLSGYLRETDSARSALTERVVRRFWHRLPWLLIGLVAAMGAAVIVGGFESQLESDVALAFFIPGVVYIADAVGTQTEALVVRGISVGVPIRSFAGRELFTGVVIGLVLALVTFPLASVLTDTGVALAVSLAVFAASAVATGVATGLPVALRHLGSDPAFGAGPLATVVQDLLTLCIYFALAVAIV
jgi:magnesium transporter